MTNIIAFWLAALIFGFLALDYFTFDMGLSLFFGKQFLVLLEYIAFWR